MSHTVAKLSRGTFFVWCVQKSSHRQHKSQKAAAKAKLRAALKEHVSWEPAEAGRMIRFTDQLDAFSGVSATQVQPIKDVLIYMLCKQCLLGIKDFIRSDSFKRFGTVTDVLHVCCQISACSVADKIASSGVPMALMSGWMDQTAFSSIHAFYHTAKAPGTLAITPCHSARGHLFKVAIAMSSGKLPVICNYYSQHGLMHGTMACCMECLPGTYKPEPWRT